MNSDYAATGNYPGKLSVANYTHAVCTYFECSTYSMPVLFADRGIAVSDVRTFLIGRRNSTAKLS